MLTRERGRRGMKPTHSRDIQHEERSAAKPKKDALPEQKMRAINRAQGEKDKTATLSFSYLLNNV